MSNGRVTDELERIGKQAVMAQFEIPQKPQLGYPIFPKFWEAKIVKLRIINISYRAFGLVQLLLCISTVYLEFLRFPQSLQTITVIIP
jgi:hypothetical protein